MPQLLVSVRNEQEAAAALRGGADWIDLKEPTRGSLGFVDHEVAERVAAAVGDQAPLSAAAGELANWHAKQPAFVGVVRQITLLKLGLAGVVQSDWKRNWLEVQSKVARSGQGLVPVMYADFKTARAPCPAEVLSLASSAVSPWVLIDTFDKATGSLLDFLDVLALTDVLGALRDRGKRTVVAGRLTGDNIVKLPLTLIDVIGVRGAACGGDRNSAICAERVARLQVILRAFR